MKTTTPPPPGIIAQSNLVNTGANDLPGRLTKAASQTRGLLYALAALAARPPDNAIVMEPQKDEVDGLVWLAMDIGEQLKTVSVEIEDDYARREHAAYLASNPEPKKGEA